MIFHIGQRIKSLAKAKGDTADSLAPILQLTASSVFKLFNQEDVSTEKLIKLAAHWQIPISAFFGEGFEAILGGPIPSKPLKISELELEIERLKVELHYKDILLSEKERLIAALTANRG